MAPRKMWMRCANRLNWLMCPTTSVAAPCSKLHQPLPSSAQRKQRHGARCALSAKATAGKGRERGRSRARSTVPILHGSMLNAPLVASYSGGWGGTDFICRTQVLSRDAYRLPMVGLVTRAGWSKLLSRRMDMLCTRCRTNFIFLDKSVQHVQICSRCAPYQSFLILCKSTYYIYEGKGISLNEP